MNTDKKQTTQLAIMGILLALCAGYFVFKFTGGKPSSRSKTSAPAVTQVGNRAVAADSEVQTERDDLESSVLPSSGRKDPFEPAFVAESEHPKPNAGNIRPGPRNLPLVPNLSALPPLGVIPRSNAGQSSVGQESTTELDFRVTGVVVGEHNVAIIHSAAGGRQVVRQGQWVGGCKVVSITQSGVVLKSGDRKIYVKLGGAKNAN